MKIVLNAKSLRLLLSGAMLLLLGGAVFGFVFAQKELQAFATSISQMEADAAAVDSNIAVLKQLETKLEGTENIQAKADAIAVPASDYPVAVIANVTSIAQQAGVKLASVGYGDTTGSTGTTGTQTTPGVATPTTPGTSPTTPTTGTADATAGGATKKTINITMQSPVNYDAFMKFLTGIETDEVYMHITKVSIAKATDNTITVQPLTIEVYVR